GEAAGLAVGAVVDVDAPVEAVEIVVGADADDVARRAEERARGLLAADDAPGDTVVVVFEVVGLVEELVVDAAAEAAVIHHPVHRRVAHVALAGEAAGAAAVAAAVALRLPGVALAVAAVGAGQVDRGARVRAGDAAGRGAVGVAVVDADAVRAAV